MKIAQDLVIGSHISPPSPGAPSGGASDSKAIKEPSPPPSYPRAEPDATEKEGGVASLAEGRYPQPPPAHKLGNGRGGRPSRLLCAGSTVPSPLLPAQKAREGGAQPTE